MEAMTRQMLLPAAVLMIWTFVMLAWMTVVAGRAYTAIGLRPEAQPPGTRGQDLKGRLPDRAMWPSHNYTHLLEQPTVFYPAVVILTLLGATTVDVVAAWGYVVLRIAHSVWQANVNTIPIRFLLFVLSSLCLLVLAVHVLLLVA